MRYRSRTRWRVPERRDRHEHRQDRRPRRGREGGRIRGPRRQHRRRSVAACGGDRRGGGAVAGHHPDLGQDGEEHRRPAAVVDLLVRRGVGVRTGGAAPRPLPGPRLHHRGGRERLVVGAVRRLGPAARAGLAGDEGGRRRGARQGRRRRVRDREHRRCRGRRRVGRAGPRLQQRAAGRGRHHHRCRHARPAAGHRTRPLQGLSRTAVRPRRRAGQALPGAGRAARRHRPDRRGLPPVHRQRRREGQPVDHAQARLHAGGPGAHRRGRGQGQVGAGEDVRRHHRRGEGDGRRAHAAAGQRGCGGGGAA